MSGPQGHGEGLPRSDLFLSRPGMATDTSRRRRMSCQPEEPDSESAIQLTEEDRIETQINEKRPSPYELEGPLPFKGLHTS